MNYTISKAQLKYLMTWADETDEYKEVQAMLQGLPEQPEITKMYIPPPQAEMPDVVYAEGWHAACEAYFGGIPPQEPLIVTVEINTNPAPFTPVTADMVTDEMVEAYLTAQRATVEEADRMWGRPNAGGLHTNTVRGACRIGLTAAVNAWGAKK